MDNERKKIPALCKTKLRGQMLVELMIAIGIAAIMIPALLTGYATSREGKPQEEKRQLAVNFLQETESAVKSIRDNNWATFSINGTFYTSIVNNAWTLVSGTNTNADGLTQKIVISSVYRTSGAIVTSGGTLDPSTKKVDITISWTSPKNTSIYATLYLTRTNNQTYTETTSTQFTAGTNTNTVVISTVPSGVPNDGQIQLGAGGGGGDWCLPQNNILATYDLTNQGVPSAISATSAASLNYAFTTTGGNASGHAIDGLTITQASSPVVSNPTQNNEAKSYGIYVDSSASYVYFNEANPPAHTVRIANVSDLSTIGYFDASHVTGTSVFVPGNTGYTTGGSTLYSFDVTSKIGSRPQLGSVGLNGSGNRVVVVGTNAYVATSDTTNQLQIINVSNPSSMSVTKNISVGNGLGAVDVYVNSSQTYAYLVTTYQAGKNDFFIIDLTNTNNIWGYSTNGMSPNSLAVVSGNRAIVVGSGGAPYQVFNVTTPSAATSCGTLTPSGVTTVYAVAPIFQGGNAYAYILTNNTSAEFQIILGGAGGQFSNTGTYESAPFDGGYTKSYNRFVATVNQPASTTISMQVAVRDAVSGTCPTSSGSYTYIGPNGTTNANDTFTQSGGSITGLIPQLDLTPTLTYKNPGQCFRYKTYFSTTDQTQTSILQDMIINLSL
jgi:type II secretory pathway pseudopilin PulG